VGRDLFEEDGMLIIKNQRICLTNANKKYAEFEYFSLNKFEDKLYIDDYPYVDLYQAGKTRNSKGRTYISMFLLIKVAIVLRPGPKCSFLLSTVFPLQKLPWQGFEYSVPANITEYLERLYGTNWMIPPPTPFRTKHGIGKYTCLARNAQLKLPIVWNMTEAPLNPNGDPQSEELNEDGT
jgi:hypothetical protein